MAKTLSDIKNTLKNKNLMKGLSYRTFLSPFISQRTRAVTQQYNPTKIPDRALRGNWIANPRRSRRNTRTTRIRDSGPGFHRGDVLSPECEDSPSVSS